MAGSETVAIHVGGSAGRRCRRSSDGQFYPHDAKRGNEISLVSFDYIYRQFYWTGKQIMCALTAYIFWFHENISIADPTMLHS